MRFFSFIFCFLGGFSMAQVAQVGPPKSWSENDLSNNLLTWNAPGFDQIAISKEDEKNDVSKDQPWRFGYKYDVSIAFSGEDFEVLEDGDRVWRYAIDCPRALSINLLFENYHLPEGAELFLYDQAKTNFVGAYTSSNNRKDGLLGTEIVHGETIVVEYYLPANTPFEGSFTISSVIHGYRSLNHIEQQLTESLNSSGDCHYDVECALGNGWEDEIRSVAMIIVGGNGVCTGALINNTCEDGRPLFLSANHCLTSGTGSWAFRFNWKTAPGSETCAAVGTSIDPGPPYDQTANGATVLANGQEADHLLLELDNLSATNILDWNLFFSGWDRSDNQSITNATCIHHPSADVMKISRENDAPYHNAISNASVWWVDQYEMGVTDGGSSGSPLYDQNHRIVGQLFGGTAACSGTNPNAGNDYFGRLGIAWNFGFDTILAPTSCGSVLVLDGWEPDAPDVFDDANLQFIESPNGTSCSDRFTPEVILRNAGDNNIATCVINYFIDGNPVTSQNWSGNLAPNQYETIVLPEIISTGGGHLFTAFTSQPNGVPDNNTVNDTNYVSFTLVPYTAETHLIIETDCYGYETAWEIKDAGNSIVASGGNAIVPPGGSQIAFPSNPYSYGNEIVVDEKLCLTEDCYTFTIYDDWGDGLEGTTQAGCSVDGNYTISDETGVVGQLQNVAFGVSETINFCVEVVGLEELTQDQFSVFPNPTSKSLQIQFNNTNHPEKNPDFEVIDLTGKVVLFGTAFGNTIDVQGLSEGSYYLYLNNSKSIPVSFVVMK